MIDRSRVRAIFFDVDGTLSDTDNLWVEQFAARLNPFKRLFPARDARPFARRLIMASESPGNLVHTFLDWVHLDDEVSHLVSFLNSRRAAQKRREYLLVPGVDLLLADLSHVYPLAVISANQAEITHGFLEHFRLSAHFKCIATGQTCAYTKPFPHPLRWAAGQIGLDPRECLMVGDTTVDIRAGRRAGAQTVGVLCGFGEEAELRRAGADLILPATPDLRAYLLG